MFSRTSDINNSILKEVRTMDKIGVFIDGGFFAVLTKYAFPNSDDSPRKIDLHLFSKLLCEENNGELLRTYLYHCPPYQGRYPSEEEKKRKRGYDSWIYALKQLKQMQIREGRLRKTFDEQGKQDFIQKGVDVLLAIDMLKLALKGAIQKIILISSDSDFVPVVRALRDEGMSVILYYYKNEMDNNIIQSCFSQDLYEECDERKLLNKELFEKTTTENIKKEEQ